MKINMVQILTPDDVLVSEEDMVLGVSLSEISTNDPGIKRQLMHLK